MASDTIDDVMGDYEFKITPMSDETTNSRAKPDPNRAVVVGRCPFIYAAKEFGMQLGVRKTYREANDFRAISIGSAPFASVAAHYFENLETHPEQGDIFEITSKPEFPKFKILDVQPDGMERIEMRLRVLEVTR
ncbi:hypothetical protein PsAD2_03025 [Pseudovibrio axinellae]|uniref:Uncharacterized protein n=2 Tax=Pseudovibrio axinellae TaxID=989403 RepID=A0A165XGP5_9HYPH|nr:hypothetical protein PsAD2_03025 [Pseudovibrio axinellae]SER43565.1 hypothetical protein SAMN05421798_11056 [Pseudovibrio axinellae]